MSCFKRNCAVLLLIVFSLFHLGIAQRLMIAMPQGESSCCVSECGCPPTSCQCEHSDTADEDVIVFEAPECSMVKTTVNGAFALMFFLPSYSQSWEQVVLLLPYSPSSFTIPNSDLIFPLERPPRLS